jgi:Secretion system C-terminal sorting domain
MKNFYILLLFVLFQAQALSQVSIISSGEGCSDFLIGTYPNEGGSRWVKRNSSPGNPVLFSIEPTGLDGTWEIVKVTEGITPSSTPRTTVLYTNRRTSATPPSTGWTATLAAPCLTTTFVIDVTLPIELVHFKAQNTEGGNQITWQTASEKNVAYFDIERSTDGLVFQKIGTLKAIGNSNTTQSYQFFDRNPLSTGYYRLKIRDLDGNTEDSKTVFIMHTKGQKMHIFPNPARYNMTVSGVLNDEYNVTDLLGRVILRGVFSENQTNIDVSAMPSGLYFLKTKNVIEKFLKE